MPLPAVPKKDGHAAGHGLAARWAARAVPVASRVTDQIRSIRLAVEDGAHAGFVFRLTVSIGIAALDRSRRALAELIGAADKALSEAKATGHNKVCVLPGVAGAG